MTGRTGKRQPPSPPMFVRRLLGSLLAVGVLVTGCSELRPVASPPSSPVSPALERYGAPPIRTPRNLTARAGSPCQIFDASKSPSLQQYERPGEERSVIGRAQGCTWSAIRPRRTVSISVWVGEDLLVDTYRAHLLPIFRPIEVDGLPAVEELSTPGSSICTTTVGVADGQSIDVMTSVDDMKGGQPVIDPCAEGRRVAEAVVATLPPA